MILLGEILPGQQVTHDQIAEALQVSTMPVREALLRLTHEGLIEGGAKARSFRISIMTRKDINDIYWTYSRLAGELTARAATLLSDVKLGELKAAHEEVVSGRQGRRFGGARVHELYVSQNYQLAPIRRRAPTLHDEHTPIHSTSVLFDSAGAGRRLNAAHADILDAIVARDPEAARSAAEDHVHARGVELTTNFDDRGFLGPSFWQSGSGP